MSPKYKLHNPNSAQAIKKHAGGKGMIRMTKKKVDLNACKEPPTWSCWKPEGGVEYVCESHAVLRVLVYEGMGLLPSRHMRRMGAEKLKTTRCSGRKVEE